MPHPESPTSYDILKESPFLTFICGIMFFGIIFLFFISLMFDFRHTKNFAITKLQDQGFEDIVIVKKYSITYMTGLPTPPFENRFDFTAVENGTHLKGTLICHRQFQDIKESQCEVEKKLF